MSMLPRNGKCAVHGGLSPGPRTDSGKMRATLNMPHMLGRLLRPDLELVD